MSDTQALSLDAAVDLLAAPAPEPEKKEETPHVEAKASPEPEAPEPDPEPALEGDDAEVEADAEEPEPEEEPEYEPLPAPSSWSADDRAHWDALPREVQEVVAKREADRDRAVSEATTKAGRAAAAVQHFSAEFERLNVQLGDEAQRAEDAWVQAWGNVDWVRVAQEHTPEEYNQYKAQADAEREQVLALRAHHQQVQREAQAASEISRQAFLAEEGERLARLAPELVDPDKGASRREQVARYVVDHGIPAEVLPDISAAEMTIAWKAMQWDNAQKAAKSKAAAPRVPQPAPRAIPPKGSGAPSKGRELQGLETRLTKSGSLDDAVALMMARQTRKR